MLLNHHFFFVGYSLEDTDFRHLHDEVVGMLRDAKRPAFAISLDKQAGARPRVLQQALSSCERKEQKTRLVALLEG